MWCRFFPPISILRNRHIGEAVGFTSSVVLTILFIVTKGNFINLITDDFDDAPSIVKAPLTTILAMSTILFSTYLGSKIGERLDEVTGGYTIFDERKIDEENQEEYYVPTDKISEDLSLIEAITIGAQLYSEERIQAEEINVNGILNADQRREFNALRRML